MIFDEPDDEPWHGTLNGYTNRRCRCARCNAANNAHCMARRADRAETPWEKIPHGTSNGYINYMCRCAECGQALAEARKSWPSAKAGKRARRKDAP